MDFRKMQSKLGKPRRRRKERISMRAKLERIAAGKIEYEKPKMSLSESLITLNCRPGEKAESSFTVTADRQIKGIVYASSSRMQVEHPSFSDRTASIG